MTTSAQQEELMDRLTSELRSRDAEVRHRAAKELHTFVSSDLREASADEANAFLDAFTRRVLALVRAPDAASKLGGVAAVVALINADACDTNDRVSRLGNYLRNHCLPPAATDPTVVELTARALARLTQVSGTTTATVKFELIDHIVKMALEDLASEERSEGKMFAAVLLLREIAYSMPTFFFQNISKFFDAIFRAIWDPRPSIREAAANALRAGLIVATKRETSRTVQEQNKKWYQFCYDQAVGALRNPNGEGPYIDDRCYRVTKEERIHGALLVLAETLRCANSEWERTNLEIEEAILNEENMAGLPSAVKRKPGEDNNASSGGAMGVVGATVRKYYNTSIRGRAASFSASTTSAASGSLVSVSAQIPFSWYGTVAVGREPIVASSQCQKILVDNFDEMADAALKATTYSWVARSPTLQSALLGVFPRIASADKSRFVYKYLNPTAAYMERLLQERNRQAFVAVGLLSVAVGKHSDKYVANVVKNVRSNLPNKEFPGKKRITKLDPAMFACISMLARASPRDDVFTSDLLESMMSVGLSPALITALHELAFFYPALKSQIASGLLEILSRIIMNKPRLHPGTPRKLIQLSQAAAAGGGGASATVPEPPEPSAVVLALRTLGSFDFQGQHLIDFVAHISNHQLNWEDKSIRLESVKTCAALLRYALASAKDSRQSATLMGVISETLSRLLAVGVTDRDSAVRCCVVQSFDDCFDYHLAQAENLSVLFVALNDEVFEIRELAMAIVGRLTVLNPAYITPSLRKIMTELLMEMEHSGVSRNREHSAKMLGHLVANAPSISRVYIKPIMDVLLPKIKETDQSTMVLTSVMRAVGDLAMVSGDLMKPYVSELLPLLLSILDDASSSSQKREISLWTLSQLVEATGCVNRPYDDYPHLLDTLLGFLKNEQRPAIRNQTLKLLGLLGALDPYKHKINMGQVDSASSGISSVTLIPMSDDQEPEKVWEMSPSELLVNMGTGNLEEFYPSVAIATLMRIIRDPTMSQYHTDVVQAVSYIFMALNIKSVPFIPQVVPSIVNVIRASDPKVHDNLFRQLGILISVVNQHIRNYLGDIFALIRDFWQADSSLQATLIGLIENISDALGCEFKIYLPSLIPQMLRVLTIEQTKDHAVTGHLLTAFKKFGAALADYMHVLLPKIVVYFDSDMAPIKVRRSALECVDHLSDSLDFSDYASLLVHPLVRCLDKTPELRQTAMDTLASIVTQLGRRYAMFIPMVQAVLIEHKINHQRYDLLCARITEGGPMLDYESQSYLGRHSRSRRRPGAAGGGSGAGDQQQQQSSGSSDQQRRAPFSASGANLSNLHMAWRTSGRVSKDDWLDWYGRLCSELLKASPSLALRACWTVSQRHSRVAKDLFNASFVSCWTELTAYEQEDFINCLKQAMHVDDLPELSQTILNLAEFMEHCDKGPLPIESDILGEQAIRCRAYAKALHYREDDFNRKATVPLVESLISVNNKLGQKEAASGLLEWGRKNLQEDLKVKEQWYEKLHEWEEALKGYQQRALEKPDDPETILGRMRCFEALGEWGDLHQLSKEHWTSAAADTKKKMARMSASAALGLKDFDSMSNYLPSLPRETQDGAFYRAVLCVHRSQWQEAQELVDLTRSLLDNEVTALSLESYQRVYPTMIAVQMLSELEEVIEYKLMPERRGTIQQMWWDRLQSCQRSMEDWQRIMQVRSIVIDPQTDQRTWLKYASLCRRSGRLQISHRALVSIMGVDPSAQEASVLPTHCPHATFAYCKHLWDADKRALAFNQLHHFVRNHLQNSVKQAEIDISALAASGKADGRLNEQRDQARQLLARCYHKLGKWQESLKGINENTIGPIREYYEQATVNGGSWYKAWHSWAVHNFEALLFHKHQQQVRKASQQQKQPVSPPQDLTSKDNFISTHALAAVQGFVRSIALSKDSSLQDTLRLLTLLFDYGHQTDVYDTLHDELRTVAIDNWLQVIPQLIARIDNPKALISRLVHQILTDLGKSHPQAIVYSLTVAAKSTVPARKLAANKILNKIREHSDTLVNQSLMVSEELIRVAILWHEQWHEGLEEASRLYFGERNIPGMLAVLKPLHALMEKGPQTLKETAFIQAYGNDLGEAKRWCERYETSGSSRDLNQAWDLYYHVFRRISRQLPKLTQLELQYVSPKLLACRDLELAVPGSYVPGRKNICIAQVQPSLQVITSKQRPRKLSMAGSDGRNYMFLLKGHEDLRQDERVMQFFSLVNSLLLNHPETCRQNLAIQRFAVIPLSTNSGLIGWVPHSDTLHGLIKDYREKKKILLNIEHRIMQKMTPNLDHLPLMNKVEVFEHSLEHTQGDDLAKILLLKAPSSEVWFERRTNFTRSLAVMSMVGYVLGLGDRHPSNLLLDRMSGKILHIDFGDCFEVAMTREKFPEKIPFRLTRMLISAMEVTGIEGTYRSTCESVMRVLRHNKDSLMAVLEAFVYDPLLNWRLIETGPKAKKSKMQAQGPTVGDRTNEALGMGGVLSAAANQELEVLTAADIMTEAVPAKPDGPRKKPSLDQPEAGAAAAALDPAGDAAAQVDGVGGQQQQLQQQHKPELLNRKALEVIRRVRDKLTGRDFADSRDPLDVVEQVDRLIEQATNNENLCQSYIGWCPFW